VSEARRLDLSLHLLDRQVVDPDGGLVCKVDDVELAVPSDGSPPYVTAILAGPAALGPRLGGLLGRWLVASHRLLGQRHDEEPDRIPFELVTDIGSSVTIARTRSELGILAGEDRVREYLVDRVPGAGHASD
jgi:sporulation protein YlmC with PRC-barrel domain